MPRPQKKADPERQLMIKTKACQRLIKESAYYEEEVKENETKLQVMKEENRDPYDIKKFEEVVDESRMMVPDSRARMRRALEDLEQYLQSDEVKEGVNEEGGWCNAAKGFDLGTKGRVAASDDVAETNLDDLAEGEAF
eukprot:CAMPEP_0113596068 /NCGR_PEP_ID=MMETSP0015_2-20120614/40107_1 /TAXON_ID=2838 /ORGANISM="Odontella" /LENGTH=137 /DNA_ID=CAMNT_0000503495 /DNA_START=39 /DNA_END=453 /DNA_ORIENTATION=+ /assembly_acc=CAM_ASM_000160